MSDGDVRQQFVHVVRRRLDEPMAEAGFPLNSVSLHDGDPSERGASVLYEGLAADFLSRYPGLDPVWDEEWRRNDDGCVDLWIKWFEVGDIIVVNLEHWGIRKLAERFGDASIEAAVEDALAGPGDMEARVGVIAELLQRSLAKASVR